MAVALALERMTDETSQTSNLHPFFTSRHGKKATYSARLEAAEDRHQKKRRRTKSPDRNIFAAPKEPRKSPEIQVNQTFPVERDDSQISSEVPKSHKGNQRGAKPAKRKKRTPTKQDDKEMSLKSMEEECAPRQIIAQENSDNWDTASNKGTTSTGEASVITQGDYNGQPNPANIIIQDAASTNQPPSGSTSPKATIPVRPLVTTKFPRTRGRPRKNTAHDDTSTNKAIPPRLDQSRQLTPPKKMIGVRSDGKLTSPKSLALPPVAVPLAQDSTNINPRSNSDPPEKTPKKQSTPKKVIKLRSDGRLASPKSQKVTSEGEIKHKRKNRRPGKSLVCLVIKYGNDPASRMRIGQRIQEVLHCPPNAQKEVKGLGSIPSGPSKATHPFFLENLSKTHVQTMKTDCNSETDGDQEGSGNPSEKTPTRKPTTNPKAWGGVTFGNHSSSLGTLISTKFPGVIEPIWPPQDMLHVRSAPQPVFKLQQQSVGSFSQVKKKLKEAALQIPQYEDVLHPYENIVQDHKQAIQSLQYSGIGASSLRTPTRHVLDGLQLQEKVQRRTQCRFSTPTNEDKEDELGQPKTQDTWNHCALGRVFRKIATSLTAFDRFECDDHDWLHKYAPRSAEEVLQGGLEATILRDWLKSLAVNSVERTDSGDRRVSGLIDILKKARNKTRKRKRKRSEELDAFIISSDEEVSELNELVVEDDGLAPNQKFGRRTVVQTGLAPDSVGIGCMAANAVVISGPHGSGKSATVYAVAQELGFEVFEINSGSRRSGKDVLDRVGDMTRNHLVYPARPNVEADADNTEDLARLNDSLKKDIESGRQGTMNALFGSNLFERRRPKSKSKGLRSRDRKEMPKQQQSQKQSMILLEEVDVLFEEDKQFWATVLELVQQSKRPIIMTCTDESLLPLEELPLFAILRYHPPPESIAVDYLLLLACNEGHLLAREPVVNLYKERNHDLRASITGLQFFCQMAIGDSKGGLDWMLLHPASQQKAIDTGQPLRVVSEDTYPINIDWVGRDYAETESANPFDKEAELLAHVWSGWGVDLASWGKFLPSEIRCASPHEKLKALKTFEEATNALSVADVIPGQGYLVGDPQQLDLSNPELTEKPRVNFTEGPTLVQADPLVDCTGLSVSISLALKVYARGICCAYCPSNEAMCLTEQTITDVLPDLAQDSRCPSKISRDALDAAFEPLAKTSKSLSSWTLSALNGPTAILVTDLAPYIRSIVSFDLRLEEHRRQLSLLTQGSRDGKRMRTTRASRAALEGGSKSTTRRERWFPPNTDFALVLQSGGPDWQKTALLRSTHQLVEEEFVYRSFRRSSATSTKSDII
ncbi:MAG: hypothetical protein Q9167_006197 [Letrouitia subvulpina]